ncbi:hypothetical protein ATANTOWER_010564 [Ataeniobius toweri]|uniref:Uncharacterized protein n=1 Tax=Ataeniobius toweri TaxID=208326 RepID=A0ABU7BSJ0_9TELE|nr:hypothetical protein [Ataeniobius toweri]
MLIIHEATVERRTGFNRKKPGSVCAAIWVTDWWIEKTEQTHHKHISTDPGVLSMLKNKQRRNGRSSSLSGFIYRLSLMAFCSHESYSSANYQNLCFYRGGHICLSLFY